MSDGLELSVHPSNVYLGAPGNLRPLPPPDKGVSPEGTRYAPVSRSLNGTGTEWYFGTKRKFSADLPWCTPTERAWVELCWDGGVAPLWLIDPLTPNRWPKGVAATGSTLRGEQQFESDSGLGTQPEPARFPGAPPRAVSVLRGNYIRRAGLPVVPTETVTFTAWARGDAELTPSATVTDTDGNELVTESGEPVAAGARALRKVTVTVTMPKRAAWAAFELRGTERGQMVTSAWRAATDGGTDWSHGGGAYRVAFTEKSSASDLVPLETVSVTFEEL